MNLFKNDKKYNIESLPAKCAITCDDFDITIEKRNDKLMMLEGKKRNTTAIRTLPSSSHSDKKEGLKPLTVDNGIYTEKTYHCPICGNKNIVRCGKCHNITCYDGSGTFKCAHCGNRGKVSGSIQQIQVHDSSYKQTSSEDKPYYPGIKHYYPGDK